MYILIRKYIFFLVLCCCVWKSGQRNAVHLFWPLLFLPYQDLAADNYAINRTSTLAFHQPKLGKATPTPPPKHSPHINSLPAAAFPKQHLHTDFSAHCTAPPTPHPNQVNRILSTFTPSPLHEYLNPWSCAARRLPKKTPYYLTLSFPLCQTVTKRSG